MEAAKPVTIISGITNVAEKNYLQINLEATAVDFALRISKNCLIRAPINVYRSPTFLFIL